MSNPIINLNKKFIIDELVIPVVFKTTILRFPDNKFSITKLLVIINIVWTKCMLSIKFT